MSGDNEDDQKKAALAARAVFLEEETAYLLALQAEDAEKQKAAVGYKSPPIDHRYKKGTSGNLRGRPRKQERARSVRQNCDDILRAGEAALEIIVNGRKVKVSAFELVLRKLHLKAAQGDFKALKMVLELRQIALIENAQANKRFHNLLEDLESEAVLKEHLPPDHAMFKRLQYWRKRSRK